MDITGRTVPAGPNLTGRMDPGMNTHIYTEYKQYVCISIRNISFLYSSLKERDALNVCIDSFNLVILGMKDNNAQYVRITNKNIFFFTVNKKMNILIHSRAQSYKRGGGLKGPSKE